MNLGSVWYLLLRLSFPLFLAKKEVTLEVVVFVEMATFRDFVTPVKFYSYFRRVVISGDRYFWSTLRDKPRERLRKRQSHACKRQTPARQVLGSVWYCLSCLSFPLFPAKEEITYF